MSGGKPAASPCASPKCAAAEAASKRAEIERKAVEAARKAAEAEAALKASAAEAASKRASKRAETERKAAEAERKAAEAEAWKEAAKADIAAAEPTPKDEKEARAWFRQQSKQEHELAKKSGLVRTSTFAQIEQTVTEHSPRSSDGAKGTWAVTESEVLDKKPARSGGWFKGTSSVSSVPAELTSTVTQIETISEQPSSDGRKKVEEGEEIQVVVSSHGLL